MMRASIKLPANMRGLAGDKATHEMNAETVGEALKSLCEQFPGLEPRLLNDRGEVLSFVNVFVDSKNLRELDGEDTLLTENAEILIVAALAGG